jgi:hypothetical protein
MRTIISLIPMDDYQLLVKFDDGTEKKVDIKPYLQLPVFSILKDINIFQKVKNHGYFIEWQGEEIDMSADTLWHDGK